MATPRRNRDRKPGRRAPFRDPKPVILIVCEGKRTEPEYLKGFVTACRNPRVRIEVVAGRGDPKSLVEIAKRREQAAKDEARRERDDNLAFDSVWCVFDMDDHPQIAAARQMAQRDGIQLAVSNPCFELWLLLHFRDHPGMQHRAVVRKLLEEFVPGFNKGVVYGTYADGYQDAVSRATQMDATADAQGERGRNPSTDVYRLTKCIEAE
jgi:hypothetical protein